MVGRKIYGKKLKKILGIAIILFTFSNEASANMKYLFATKLVCDKSEMYISGKEENGLNKVDIRELGQIYLAFNNTTLWISWDPINQKFKEKYKITNFAKEKIETETVQVAHMFNSTYFGVSLNRVTGDGTHWEDYLKNCEVVNKLPSKSIKQKF